jgi:hypothetical protein
MMDVVDFSDTCQFHAYATANGVGDRGDSGADGKVFSCRFMLLEGTGTSNLEYGWTGHHHGVILDPSVMTETDINGNLLLRNRRRITVTAYGVPTVYEIQHILPFPGVDGQLDHVECELKEVLS